MADRDQLGYPGLGLAEQDRDRVPVGSRIPDGLVVPSESLADCLRRELQEELAVDSAIGDEIFAVTHHYPGRSVELHFFACTLLGEPVPLLGQEMRWVPRTDLASLQFPPADDELIQRLTT